MLTCQQCCAEERSPYANEYEAQWDDSVASKKALGGPSGPDGYGAARGAIAATAAVRIALVVTVLLAGAWTAQQRAGALVDFCVFLTTAGCSGVLFQ